MLSQRCLTLFSCFKILFFLFSLSNTTLDHSSISLYRLIYCWFLLVNFSFQSFHSSYTAQINLLHDVLQSCLHCYWQRSFSQVTGHLIFENLLWKTFFGSQLFHPPVWPRIHDVSACTTVPCVRTQSLWSAWCPDLPLPPNLWVFPMAPQSLPAFFFFNNIWLCLQMVQIPKEKQIGVGSLYFFFLSKPLDFSPNTTQFDWEHTNTLDTHTGIGSCGGWPTRC